MKKTIFRSIAAGAAALLAVAAFTGCSSTSGGGSGDKTEPLTVGVSISFAANETVQAVVAGLEAELSTFDAKLIQADANLSVDKQISDIDSFVNKGVDAIVVIPIDLATIKNALDRADTAGIPIFANDAVVGNDVTAEQLSPVIAQVHTNRPADAVAGFIADKTGGKGQVGAITIAAPVAQIQYFVGEVVKNLEASGMSMIGEPKGNPTDDAAGARPLAEAMLTQNPNLAAIFSYNDPSAIGASAAAKAAGKRDQVVITGFNASKDGLAAIEDGTIDATWDYRAPEQGQLLGRLVKTVVIDGKKVKPQQEVDSEIVTKENVGEFISWADRVDQIKAGKYEGIQPK